VVVVNYDNGDELFLTPPPPPSRDTPPPFSQGVVEAWNAVAGTNTVRVRGKSLTNLLSLVGSEGGLIRPGDVVCVIFFQDTAAVLGRIDAPGVEQRALGIHTARVFTGVSSLSDNWEDLGGPEVTVYIGSSRRCKVDLSAFIDAVDCIGFAGVRVSGASTIAPTEWNALATGGPSTTWINATKVVTLSTADGLNEGDNTFRMFYKTSAGGPDVAGFRNREITVQPF
jgi:hypothetical protein